MIVISAALDSVRMKGGEWKIVLNVPQTDTELVSQMVNTCQEKLLQITVTPQEEVIVGKEA